MLKNRLKYSLIIMLGLATVGCSNDSEKIGVVDLLELYQSFDYQKELEIEFVPTFQRAECAI